MLRLTLMEQDATEAIVAVDGWITGEDVDLLEREGQRWLQQVPHLVLVMDGVRFVDLAGIELLKHWVVEGKVMLQGGALFIQTLLQAHGLMTEEAATADE